MATQRYAHIKNGAIWRRLNLDPADVPIQKQSYLLPIVEEPKPARESVIQTLDRIETIEVNRVHVTWILADLPLDQVKISLKKRVDVDAGNDRLKYITDAPGQTLTYDRKRREAEDALVDATPDATKYPVLSASIGIEVANTGVAKTDFDAMANLVLDKEASWATIAQQIEAARMGAKTDIDASVDVTEAWAVYQAIIWSV